MRIVGVHVSASDDAPIRFDLSCGHVVRGKLPSLEPGDEFECPECEATGERRAAPQPLSDELLAGVAHEYQRYMESTGVVFPPEAQAVLLRAARIQDAWRLAFKRVLG
jgi:hypothetical protein